MLHSSASPNMPCQADQQPDCSQPLPLHCSAQAACASGQLEPVITMQLPQRACSPFQDLSQAAQTPLACTRCVPVLALSVYLHCARACCLHGGACCCVTTAMFAQVS